MRAGLFLLHFSGIVSMLLISCTKEEEKEAPPVYKIEGHFYGSCAYDPVVGVPLILVQNGPNGNFPYSHYKGDLDTFKTDSSGYFKFNYSRSSSPDELFVRFWVGEAQRIVASDFLKNVDLLDLDLFLYPAVDIEVSLNILNPYSENDTLIFQNFTKEGFKISGPYKSGFLFSIEDAPLFEMNYKENYYSLGWNHLPFDGLAHSEYFSIEKFCDNTVYLTIDIE